MTVIALRNTNINMLELSDRNVLCTHFTDWNIQHTLAYSRVLNKSVPACLLVKCQNFQQALLLNTKIDKKN